MVGRRGSFTSSTKGEKRPTRPIWSSNRTVAMERKEPGKEHSPVEPPATASWNAQLHRYYCIYAYAWPVPRHNFVMSLLQILLSNLALTTGTVLQIPASPLAS